MTDSSAPTVAPRDALNLIREGGPGYYRHLDLDMVRRIGAVAVGIAMLAAAAVLPVAPPTATLPDALGWALALAAIGAGLAGVGVLLAGLVGVRGTYVAALVTVAGLGAIDWLAGADAPYDRLLAIPVVWAAAAHTPRRVLVILGLAALVRIPMVAEGSFAGREIAETLLQVLVWAGLSALAVVWSAGVRVQRDALQRLEAQARTLARVDALTGLGNRRAFDEAADAELARAARAERPLSLLVTDRDAFKAINDDHGHLAGDDCLRQVAGVLRAELRRPDAVFRWGGDEFVVLLAEADVAEATTIGERLAEAGTTPRRAPDGRPLTFGFGVAERRDGDTPESLIARADAALLLAKA